MSLTPRERIIRTFEGKDIDRIATYDIMHNTDLMENLTVKKITPENAEDVACAAVGNALDLVRHFSIPGNLEPEITADEDGFIHKKEWWTVQVLEPPY